MDRVPIPSYAGRMTNANDRREDAQQDAIKDLERLERESDFLGRSALRRARAHFSADDAAAEKDWTELWGRRIGRVLSLIGVIALAIYLYATYMR